MSVCSTSISIYNTVFEPDTIITFTPEQERGIEPFQSDTNSALTDPPDTEPEVHLIPYELPLHRLKHSSNYQCESDAVSAVL